MVISLLVAAYGFSFLKLNPEDENRESSSNEVLDPKPSGSEAAIIILLGIMLYVASYALGLGNVPWMQSELFPLSVRSLGSGVATSTNWGANFLLGLTFLPLMMDWLTPSWTFVLYAIICAVGLGLIWMVYPETAGMSLEETAVLLENGWR